MLSMQNVRGENNLEMSYPALRRASVAKCHAGRSGCRNRRLRPDAGAPAAVNGDRDRQALDWSPETIFELLGTQPVLGRLFTNEIEETRTSQPTMVLSHRLWQTRFAGSAGVVGQTIFVQNVPFTIVGVAPPGFFGHVVGESPDAWIPATAQPRLWSSRNFLESAGVDWVRLIARLRPDATVQSARGRSPDRLPSNRAGLGRERRTEKACPSARRSRRRRSEWIL